MVIIDQIIEYMNNKNYHNTGKKINNEISLSLIEIQILLCKLLKNCYIYTDFTQDDNTRFQLYNNILFGFVKQNNNMLYIWKIK